MIRGILLDIEGTTTPISFVHNVLFSYARRHVPEYVRTAQLDDLRREYEEDVAIGHHPPTWANGPVAYVEWLMDQDRKSTALKRIQGEIWFEGYRTGDLQSQVFEDVPPALESWSRSGIDLRIFSSGSVLAQQLLFANTTHGDLTKYFRGYFDTTTGAKGAADSYRKIADAFGLLAPDILFLSDVTVELDAARDVGMQTALCIREGNHPQPHHMHRTIHSFSDLT